jgi:hypothetical protein
MLDSGAAMLYVSPFAGAYVLYISVLRGAIALAVFLSILVSLDRLYKVWVYAKVSLRWYLTGHKPEHDYQPRKLPDPAHHAASYPKVISASGPGIIDVSLQVSGCFAAVPTPCCVLLVGRGILGHFNQALLCSQVAVQLPMFNERAVCQSIIDSACELAWPRERFCVQVGNPFRLGPRLRTS